MYVDVAGRLDEIDVEPDQLVHKGDRLAVLSNIDLQLSIAELEGKREQQVAKLESLRRNRHTDKTSGLEVPQAVESLAAIDEQLRQKHQDVERLTLTAPQDGHVLPPPAQTSNEAQAAGQLPNWTGSPLQKKNLGAHLNESTLYCQIGDPTKMEAVLVVEQDDVQFIRENDSVAVLLDELPNSTYHSTIIEIAQNDLKVIPRQLSQKAGGEVITKSGEANSQQPLNTSYQARAPLDNADGLLRNGLRGQAKIHARWQTLAGRGWR